MGITIKCLHGLKFHRYDNKLEIEYDNVTVIIHDDDKVQEVIFQIVTLHEHGGGDLSEPECHLELSMCRNPNHTFKYPYSLRDVMLQDYENLRKYLEKNMSEPEID